MREKSERAAACFPAHWVGPNRGKMQMSPLDVCVARVFFAFSCSFILFLPSFFFFFFCTSLCKICQRVADDRHTIARIGIV